jgi:arylsulfatase A-like enzyme
MRSILRLLVVAALVLTCGKDTSRFNVLLIGIDTLRADHLGCYGYERSTSPNIDQLAEEGIAFETAVSQCPWTLPSFASVLTSLYPTQHGAGINMSQMGTAFPTMSGILGEEGYASGAILSSRVLSPEFGVSRGFGYYNVNMPGEKRDALKVTQLALSWLDALEGQPFFLFVHYFDPHMPYCPPEPYDTLFDNGERSSLGPCFDITPLLEDGATLGEHLADLTTGDWGRVVSLYDGEIAFTDMAIGRLLSGLLERGLRRNTLVVLLSDHGEEFYEHGGLGHGHTLFSEVIRVPLIVSLAEVLPRQVRVKGQVRMVDVLPTVLDVLGIEREDPFEGVSLLGMVDGGRRALAREGALFPAHLAYSEGLRRGSERKSVSAHPWKLIYDTETGSDLVFNLADDPEELRPVPGSLPGSVPLLKDALMRSLFRMNDTWYVEMVPGRVSCEFGLRISVEHALSRGNFTLCRYITADGSICDPYGIEIEPSRLTIEGLGLSEPLTLAFQVDSPPGLPVTFELSVDGRLATDRTYLGKRLLQAKKMPLSLSPRYRGLKVEGPPSDDRPPPYLAIRHSEAEHPSRKAASLGPGTTGELRALGYIQ